MDEGSGAEDDIIDIANTSSDSEVTIGARVAKSFLGESEIGVIFRWAVLGLGPCLFASDMVEVCIVTGWEYMLSKGMGLVLGRVLTASISSESSESSEERPPSSLY